MALPVDRSLVDRLVVEHLPAGLHFALRLTGNEHSAEDVMQEALCRVLRQWRSFRSEASFKTWLFQIVVNVDRDRRRRRTFETLDREPACPLAEPADRLAVDEMDHRVRDEIGRLPDRQREVAILCLGEGMRAEEVATILGITEPNVHSSLHLARKRIAKAIGFDYAPQKRS
ncbi:MAG: RNA polymerase sigma factor [Pirellulales bacterium]